MAERDVDGGDVVGPDVARLRQLAEVSDLNLVVMMTIHAPSVPWAAPNNALIHEVAASHPNVKILDWDARSAEVADGLSKSDGGIHLNSPEAKAFYTQIILEALGLA